MKKFVTGVLNISGCFYRKRCFAMNQYRWNDLVDWFGRKCRFPFVAFFDLNVQDFHSGSGNLVDLPIEGIGDLEVDGARIHFGGDFHNRNASTPIAIGDCRLDGRGAAVFGQ